MARFITAYFFGRKYYYSYSIHTPYPDYIVRCYHRSPFLSIYLSVEVNQVNISDYKLQETAYDKRCTRRIYKRSERDTLVFLRSETRDMATRVSERK